MLNKTFKILYITLIIIFIVSFFQLKNLPIGNKILVEMMNEPIQATTTVFSKFNFNYRDKNYKVEPIADYELWGLIVSINDINKWYNMYHNKNSVNLKDICIIWGENIVNSSYDKMNFKNGEWTCYARWGSSSREEIGKFRGDKLSNNHLFSDKKKVRQIIRRMKIGDQIYIKGALSKYAENNSSHYRGTSLTRTDKGNGACETIYVKKAEILKKGMPTWYFLQTWSKNLFIFLIILQSIIFLRKMRRESLLLKNISK